MIMYKAKRLSLGLCCCRKLCSYSMPKGNYNYVTRFSAMIRLICVVFFGTEVVITFIDLVTTDHVDGTPSNEIESFNYLDIIQIVFTCVVMYLLVLFDRLARKIVKRDDPFTNATIYSILIFIVVIQKYILDYIMYTWIPPNQQAYGVVIRQTVMSIELLFIQIPIRHNFSIAYLEP